jgi:hypothetical protein
MNSEPLATKHNLRWDFNCYEDWYRETIYVRNINQVKYNNDWCHLIVKLTDYVANPSIQIKYQEVFEQLMLSLPELEYHEDIFRKC